MAGKKNRFKGKEPVNPNEAKFSIDCCGVQVDEKDKLKDVNSGTFKVEFNPEIFNGVKITAHDTTSNRSER